ncbi:MAG: hypoxanthine phosphoribosyltransferase [Planctomycetaceae bacterium]
MQTLISEDAIQKRVTELGDHIGREFAGQPLTILGILTGSVVFLADLIRKIELPLQLGLIQASSYRGKVTTPGELEINLQLIPDLINRNVILVDDIFDTGRTLSAIIELVRQHQPLRLESAVLLKKQGRCEVDLEPDHVGFTIPDTFVVGYGLDYDDDHRHLPHIATLEPADLG